MYIKCIHIWLIVHFCGPFWWPIPYIIDSRLVPVVWRDFLEIKWSDHQPEEAHGSPKIMGLLLKMTWLSWWVFPWKKQLLVAPLRCTKLLTCSSIPSARKWRTLLMCRGGHFRGCKSKMSDLVQQFWSLNSCRQQTSPFPKQHQRERDQLWRNRHQKSTSSDLVL